MLVPWYANESCPYNTANHLRSPQKCRPRCHLKHPRVSLQASPQRHHPRRCRQILHRNPLQSPPRILPPSHRRCHHLLTGSATFHFLLLDAFLKLGSQRLHTNLTDGSGLGRRVPRPRILLEQEPRQGVWRR
jgi:hypothetical protein